MVIVQFLALITVFITVKPLSTFGSLVPNCFVINLMQFLFIGHGQKRERERQKPKCRVGNIVS